MAVGKTGHIAFVATSKPMLHMLLDDKPEAMGGAELQLFLHAQHLVKVGWKVTFIVGNYPEAPERASLHGMNAVKGPLPPNEGLFGRVDGLRKFRHTLKQVGADIYVTRGLTGQAGVVAHFCRQNAIDYVFWFGKNADAWYGDPANSPLGFFETRLAGHGIRNATEVVVQSDDQSRLLMKHIGRGGYLIRNIHPRNGHMPAASRGSAIPSYVLWAASLQPKKRPLMVLEIAETMPDIQFMMIGGPSPGMEGFAREFLQANKPPNVRYEGFIPYSQTDAYFADALCFLNTSQPELEGFPNTYLQAWGHGVPVVGTCDPDGIIHDFDLGRYGEASADLIAGIGELRDNHASRAKCSMAATAYVRDKHGPEAVFGALDALLDDITAAHAQGIDGVR